MAWHCASCNIAHLISLFARHQKQADHFCTIFFFESSVVSHKNNRDDQFLTRITFICTES